MGKNVYKTAQGQSIDIDNLRLVNETTVAVGNMRVNARGDQVAPDGTVITPRNQLMKEQYKLNTPVVKTEKSTFGAKTIKRSEGALAASIANETAVAVQPTPSQPVSRPTNGLRGSLAQSVVDPESEAPVADDLQADLELIKPKQKITRI